MYLFVKRADFMFSVLTTIKTVNNIRRSKRLDLG